MQRRSTSQDVSWFLDLRRGEQLDLNPPYQRRSVWNRKDRKFFLDTVFRGYPSPPIFLHKTVNADQRTVYAVVDGKQRLQTLFMFVDDEIALGDLEDERLNGKTWGRLTQTERQIFWDYVLPVEFLTFDEQDPHEVTQAFDRLNRNMRKLEAQELRHARWDGWFIDIVEGECEDQTWKRLGIVTNARAKRMKDAQFLSELLLVLIERKQHGFDQQALDIAYAKYDDLDELDELEPAVEPDEVKNQLATNKQYLVSMQETNNCVRDHAGTFAAFYTLWVAVALHRGALPPAREFADIFKDFRNKADEIEAADDKAALLAGPDAIKYKRAQEFTEGYRGASTDLRPREKRLAALLGFVRGD